MCDEKTVADNERFLAQSSPSTSFSRREFGALTSIAAMALLLPSPANAADVVESDVSVPTPDGTADCYFVHPASGKHPGVIIWPDALGLRPAFRLMGKRLAESGYSVLVVNQYYRKAEAPVIAEGASFQDPSVREVIMPLAQSLSTEGTASDGKAFVEFLDAQGSVDTGRKVGTMGYCMGGAMTIRTAAAVPERVGACASFHGGRLVTDQEDSPHLLIPLLQASFLIAIAENDDEKEPNTKDVLRKTIDEAGLKAEIEVYEGTLHGWCPPDSAVYNEAQAERAWSRLLVLFEEALA